MKEGEKGLRTPAKHIQNGTARETDSYAGQKAAGGPHEPEGGANTNLVSHPGQIHNRLNRVQQWLQRGLRVQHPSDTRYKGLPGVEARPAWPVPRTASSGSERKSGGITLDRQT